jgi:regulator of protease activity HflC (stomatin/prohibitin superfamily)
MFQNKRSEIQETMFKQLKIKLQGSETEINDEGVYAFANSLQLENVELPLEYKNAIAEKQRAQEDIALALNQRSQELTKANTELLAAKEEIKIILARAQNERNVTITEAQNIADQTLFAFEKETEVLQRVLNDFSLDANGIIAYMANQLYANAPKLKVSIGEPARVSRKDEL